MEDDQNGRRPKWKTIKMDNDENGRWPKGSTTKMKDDQHERNLCGISIKTIKEMQSMPQNMDLNGHKMFISEYKSASYPRFVRFFS